MAFLWRIFPADIFIVGLWQHDAASNEDMIYAPDFMRLIPTKKEDWQNLVSALFKAYVVTAYIIWKLSSIYISGEGSPFMPPFAVTSGYILSIVVLSFVAGVQKGRKQNEAAVRTLVFIVIGVVFLSISFQAGSI